MGRIVGFEPTTAGATDRCSTAELYPPCRTSILAEQTRAARRPASSSTPNHFKSFSLCLCAFVSGFPQEEYPGVSAERAPYRASKARGRSRYRGPRQLCWRGGLATEPWIKASTSPGRAGRRSCRIHRRCVAMSPPISQTRLFPSQRPRRMTKAAVPAWCSRTPDNAPCGRRSQWPQNACHTLCRCIRRWA